MFFNTFCKNQENVRAAVGERENTHGTYNTKKYI